MSFYPVVYKPVLIADFVYNILQNHTAPTILLICSEKASFLSHIHASAASSSDYQGQEDDGVSNEHLRGSHPLLAAYNLRAIFASHSVSVVFCSSVPALHAYLTTLPRPNTVPWPRKKSSGGSHASVVPDPEGAGKKNGGHGVRAVVPVLALVNAISLHRESASFSAQGLGRAYAAAAEAAERSRQRLVLFESLDQPPESRHSDLFGLYGDGSSFHPADEGEEEQEYGNVDYTMAMQDLYEEDAHVYDTGETGVHTEASTDVPMAETGEHIGEDDAEDEDGDEAEEDLDGEQLHLPATFKDDDTAATHKFKQKHEDEDENEDEDEDDDEEVKIEAFPDPWAVEIPILSATTKSYGGSARSLRGSGWIGKKVAVGEVAARWCTFESLPPPTPSPPLLSLSSSSSASASSSVSAASDDSPNSPSTG